jgi:hypothetical protein
MNFPLLFFNFFLFAEFLSAFNTLGGAWLIRLGLCFEPHFNNDSPRLKIVIIIARDGVGGKEPGLNRRTVHSSRH